MIANSARRGAWFLVTVIICGLHIAKGGPVIPTLIVGAIVFRLFATLVPKIEKE